MQRIHAVMENSTYSKQSKMRESNSMSRHAVKIARNITKK